MENVPYRHACVMQDDVAGCFEYYADLAEKQDKQLETPVELPMAEFTSIIRHEPLGPVGLISSFNYPMLIATVRPALAGPVSYHSAHCLAHQSTQISRLMATTIGISALSALKQAQAMSSGC